MPQYLNDKYAFYDPVGEGTFGEVFFGVDLDSGAEVAIKTINKEDVEYSGLSEYLDREKAILRRIHSSVPGGHKNICRIYDIIDDDEKTYIVMEYARGGSLLQSLEHPSMFRLQREKGRGPIHEKFAKHLFRQMVSATEFLHKRHRVVHRDLQLGNILIDVSVPVDCHTVMKNTDIIVKIADFGLACPFTPGVKTLGRDEEFCGTPQYCAPELFHKEEFEGPEVDIWALGVCLYRMVVGVMPFRFSKDTCSGTFSIPLEATKVSEECRDLLARMLDMDMEKRATLSDIKAHPWMRNVASATVNLNSPTLGPKLPRTGTSPTTLSPLDAAM